MEIKEELSRRVLIIGVGAASVIFLMLLPWLQESFFQMSVPTFDSMGYVHVVQNEGNRDLWGTEDSSAAEANENAKLHLRRLVKGENLTQLETIGISCLYHLEFEQCIIEKPVIVTSTKPLIVYIPSNEAPENLTIKPYARRNDQTAMKEVTPVEIRLGNHWNISNISCEVKHEFPAMVFSSGGFTGNIFHELNEIIIPLYITSRHFENQVEFVITDYGAWWVDKYKNILKKLSPFEPMNGDTDGRVHCFPGAVIGLRYHDNIALNTSDIPEGHTMSAFRHFIGDAYNMTMDGPFQPRSRPRLLLVSRQQSRVILNENKLVKMMEDLGFEVGRAWANQTGYLDHFAPIVNSYDVLLGVHGAGLTNEVFLRNGSVVVQVVLLSLDWAAENYYAIPAHNMGLKYLKYKIEPKESSLYGVYGPNDPIIYNETTALYMDYRAARAIYIDGQNATINEERFKSTLLLALKFLGYPTPQF